ncbi:MAG: hypothetical protein ACXW5J_20690 [Thermoanaerobaculia bacterium]
MKDEGRVRKMKDGAIDSFVLGVSTLPASSVFILHPSSFILLLQAHQQSPTRSK